MLTFPDGFQQRWLWEDPLQPDPAAYYGAVLRAEEIRRYIDEFNLLVDKTTFREENLKGASYTMSPDANEGWRISGEGEHVRLDIKESSRGRYYVVPRNSLVYIRLNDELRLPFYVIGRHNLKIDYVYQGLLLGTGPQVDPGYIGRIYIPLHNLTNQQVEVYVQESFVSIDFVRTSPLLLDKGTPETFQDFYDIYGPSKKPILLEKVAKKTNLNAYLQGSKPSSSLGNLVGRFEDMDAQFQTRRYVELAVIGVLVTILSAFFYHVDRELRKTTTDALTRYIDVQKDLERLNGEVRRTLSVGESAATSRQVESLRKDLDRTLAEVQRLKDELARERVADQQ